jgi:tryptophan-rich sensory protein
MKITCTIKNNYIVIITLALLTMFIGSYFSWGHMEWYRTLTLPAITPPDWIFKHVWTIIYILTTLAALIVWNRFERNKRFVAIMALFALNAVLNASWTYFFFYNHAIGAALIDAIAVQCTTIALGILIAQSSWLTALLLTPYIAWNFFAIVLNALIWWNN